MAFNASTSPRGIPFMYGTGDNTTLPSNEVKITASDAATFDSFGSAVAAGSGRIAIGAWDKDGSGAVYLYDLDGNLLVKFLSSDLASGDNFGRAIAIGSSRIVVGATRDDDAGTSSGSAYIFDLNGNEIAKITASDAAAGDQFGGSVAVGSGRICVGAYTDDDNGSDSGSAYIYDLDGNELAKITASDGAAGDYFGHAITVGSGRIVVGAFGDDGAGTDSGSAYIFDLDGNQIAKITASDAAASDFF